MPVGLWSGARKMADELRDSIRSRDEQAAVRHIDNVRKSAWIKDEAGTYPVHEAVQQVNSTSWFSGSSMTL